MVFYRNALPTPDIINSHVFFTISTPIMEFNTNIYNGIQGNPQKYFIKFNYV